MLVLVLVLVLVLMLMLVLMLVLVLVLGLGPVLPLLVFVLARLMMMTEGRKMVLRAPPRATSVVVPSAPSDA